MYTDKDSRGLFSIMEMTLEDVEIFQIAVTRNLNDLPEAAQIVVRRLMIQIDKLTPTTENDTTKDD